MAGAPVPLTFVGLSPALIDRYEAALIDVASDVPDEYWTKDHFLRDLPLKWALSFVATAAGQVRGYAILSRKAPGHAHLHHFMVHRDHRSGYIGAGMLQEIRRRVGAHELRRLTLKIAADNRLGQSFYRRHGFQPVDTSGDYHLYQTDL